VITDHGKRDNPLFRLTALTLPKEQQTAAARAALPQGDEG
jgi:hypothetical protein